MNDQKDKLIDAIDKHYGITSHLIGNGCEHGFKPAADCPNVDCEEGAMHRLWNSIYGDD